ncbi:MAG: pyridoxal-phosphate dependent enzyme [archaeon]
MTIIDYLSCDICGIKSPLQNNHEHPELEIGGVPLNIWTPVYSERPSSLLYDTSKTGIARYGNHLAFLADASVCYTEGSTPLYRLETIEGDANFFIKDESCNPTRSFKDRGMALLVSDALRQGYKTIAIPSTGNAAISLGYYASRAGIQNMIFIPEGTPASKIELIKQHSQIQFDKDLIESYEHFFRFCRSHPDVYNGFPATNLPYLEGMKTTAYEIFQQFSGGVPDWIIVPVGSGGNIVGMYNGFKDLFECGAISVLPRIMAVQIEGADPIAYGFRKGIEDKVVVLETMAESQAEAIASDTCFNYLKIINLLKKTGGVPVSVTDEEIESFYDQQDLPRLEFSSCSVFAAAIKAEEIQKGQNVVLIGTAGRKG